MFCPKCGTQNPDDGRFCRSCGADLGNVSAALTGRVPEPQKMVNRRGRPINWESALTKLSMGVAFVIVSFILGVTKSAPDWWFWMLIPAFLFIGNGVAQIIQIKKSEQKGVSFTPQNKQNTISSAPPANALPPTQTDYVAPPRASIYDTGELAERPGSVTENTTRHLEIDSEGETMTLPKK
jgi:hypothetical protein